GAEFDITHSRPLEYIDRAVMSIENIKKACDEKGINFILIGSPMYDSEIECYDPSQIAELATKIAQVTDFYNFWGYNAFSHDARYFYDGYHFRNAIGSAALAYIFENKEVYIPESFGRLTTADSVDFDLAEMNNPENGKSEMLATKVPVLMYHALTANEDEASDTVITVTSFEEQIKALAEAGYSAVFFDDLRDYVKNGAALPEKPIVITFDDGYSSNLELALPVLEKYGQCATTNVIGVSVGKDTYKDTGKPMYPHFSLEEARDAFEKGVFDFQSHTYDMHQNSYDEDPRDGMLQKKGEREADYISALRLDFSLSSKQLSEGIGNDVFVITYPHGKYTPLTDAVLMESGAEISVTVENGTNEIIKGLPQSLRGLKRLNMTDAVSGEALLEMIEY
ncbi:MAG: polysaccharide deacetylase family protein, partial [Clostridia bacterium]|nr:polysaccharide deacetylase family protein [Clostridia bacterium]